MKTFLKIYISLCLILSPIFFINSANAATVGGWSLGGGVAQGASTVYQGTKQVIIDGKDYIKKGAAKITPVASQVSKVLARGAAGYALSIAVEQLLGSVDWVLDPANNQIKYNSPDQPLPTYYYIWIWNATQSSNPNSAYLIGTTPQQACQKLAPVYSVTLANVSNINITSQSQGNARCNWTNGSYQYVKIAPNPAYDPNAEKEKKTLPLDVVSAQVISNAESGDSNAQVATTAAAADIVAESESDNVKARPIVQQLEATATTTAADADAAAQANSATGTQTQNPTKPGTTDLKLSFPVFCGWAPIVCEAAQVAISFPAKAQIWVNDLLGQGQKIEEEQKRTTAEAAKTAQATQAIQQELTNSNDLPQKDTSDIVLPDLPITPQTVNVNWGNSCPPPTTATLSIFGQSTEITLINYDAICEWAWVVEYSVIALASISSVFIVAGRKS
jgi:hypothetical protein